MEAEGLGNHLQPGWEPVLLSVSCRSCNRFQGGLCILAGALIAEYLLQISYQ